MYILGISCFYHDASATLLKDGLVIAAAEEERFSRKKHDQSFPKQAIEFCLGTAEIDYRGIDLIAFYEKPLLKFERVLYQHLAMFPRSLKTFIASVPTWFIEKFKVTRFIRKELNYKGDIVFLPHHLAHAASAFLPSPFETAAILTVDGVGEWSTTTCGFGKGIKIELQKEIRFPNSIGLLYSTITAYLGFSVNNSEYKVMGLAAYGDMNPKTNPYFAKLSQVIDIKADGSFRLDMSYFVYHYRDRMPSGKLCELLEGPIVSKGAVLTQRHKDIAAAVQLITEKVMTKMLLQLSRKTGLDEVVLAGGVALNSVYNGKILSQTPFKKVWIQPNASDGGGSMGAALYAWSSILRKPRHYRLTNAYLGPAYSKVEIQHYLDTNSVKYRTFTSETQLIKTTAKLIKNNYVLGWFQLGMEWGPRALGARSILSNPTNPKMQAILNEKVKHREKFRPFAPVVLAEEAEKYFDIDKPLPDPADYMLMVYPIRPKYREKIPAVTHVDGSGRLQTIHREQNSRYYDLIKEFGRLSGIPIMINTSFNVRGEPIVCTPNDAYRCLMGTGIDYVVMGDFLIKRDDNMRDAWDSEMYARDD